MTDRRIRREDYLTKLSPDNCVLVPVDYLTGFLPGIRTIDPQTYQHNVTAFCRLGQIFAPRLPTLILGDEGGFRGQFMPQVEEYLSHAPRFARHTPSGWHAEGFADALKATGRRKVVMGGISLDNCVLQTALDVMAAGYEVYVLPDVSGTDSLLVEPAAMMRLGQAGAVMTNWVSLASELMGDWQSPEGEAVGALYKTSSKWGGG
jgi:hypothetical protein